ncbi:MAG TPA: acetylornithine deacetylase [Xanthobacteraceae bacterium]|nr:acetylornithine deacetylase [Xanthobacteraceae bacterium]
MADRKTVDILEALVGFDTTSRNSNLALIAWVESYLDRFAIAHERVLDATGAKANLWATIGPASVPGYILSGHTDVVPVDGQSWSADPFHLTARDGRLYGRGAADMKGFLACCLAAVPDMIAHPLARPIHLAFSYDEEVGCIGVRGLIARLEHAPATPAGCFVGEPTEMNVIIGHKAKRSLRVTVRGQTCHSALAPKGVNAVEYAARLIVRIREIADRLAQGGARDPLYDVPFTTGHTGTVQGGTALNIVPDQCTFEFEFRSIAADSLDALVGEVMAYARDVLEPEMRAVAPHAGFAFEIKSGFPGLDTTPGANLVDLTKRLSGQRHHGKVAFGTEAGLFDEAGIPSVVIGPGSIEQAHKADEFIAVAELAKCDRFIDGLVAHCRR